MRTSITVSIPKPCHEDWSKMSPKDKGRHCAVCSKTVVDFTNQTDEQIIKAFKTNGNLCGRFKNQQLDREIVLARKEKNNLLNIAASGMFALLAIGSQKSTAQTEPIKIIQTDSINAPLVKGKIAHSVLNEKVISGVVTTKSDGLSLPGVAVNVKGANKEKEVFTDFDGKYTIKAKINDTLVFSYLSMKMHEEIIKETTTINVKMLDDKCSLDYVVLGYSSYSINSECRKQKRIEKRIKRKEERILSRKTKTKS